ncbi:MAG: tRNA 4-thiouridine(8) synthase ThiI [Chloroflexi bacterium]|nr:tRNA 4-thiouridine(8) synthase ThiI [Chloroflexota bacterium]
MGFILLRYGEIGLKGNNRFQFVRQLRRNIRAALAANGIEGQVISQGQRLYVHTEAVEAACPVLQRVFGLVSLSPATSVERDPQAIAEACIAEARRANVSPEISFRVRARRADKSYPYTSPEISRSAGEAVQAATGGKVDLSDRADVTIGVEISPDRAIIFGNTLSGPGGLPVGVGGRAVALLSGGIDSPVAAWMMLKRGCGVIPLHVASSESEIAKVRELVEILQSYCHGWQLHLSVIDYAEMVAPDLERLVAANEGRWTCLVCKHRMLQHAEALAEGLGASAIITGDSLGQVASQTLANMALVSQGIKLPILRPLIGMDKTEIISIARAIGTFETSIRSASACQFLPNHPVTEGQMAQWQDVLAIAGGETVQ